MSRPRPDKKFLGYREMRPVAAMRLDPGGINDGSGAWHDHRNRSGSGMSGGDILYLGRIDVLAAPTRRQDDRRAASEAGAPTLALAGED
ncbi:hypothetical protein [Sphingomonas oryzagri]